MLPVPAGSLPTPLLLPPFSPTCAAALSLTSRRFRAAPTATTAPGLQPLRAVVLSVVAGPAASSSPGTGQSRSQASPQDGCLWIQQSCYKEPSKNLRKPVTLRDPLGIILGHLQEVLQSSSGSDRELSGAQLSMGGRSFPGGLPTVLWLLQESRPCLQSAGNLGKPPGGLGRLAWALPGAIT